MSEALLTKEKKVQRYKKLNEHCLKGQTVFAGSSLMEMFPIEKFTEEDHLALTVYNRGIGGYVTQELLDNIDTCILDLKPSRLFINIGTNDLSRADISIGEIMTQYEKLLDQVLDEIPDCRIYLMAYYPVNYEAAVEGMKPVLEIRSNEKITLANQAVRELAGKKGLRFIDVNDPLKDNLGRLKAEYTIEGMHITEDGYRAIYPLVRNYLIKPD